MHFSLVHDDSATQARAGLIQTDHGSIETPVFMPVGTAGTVKSVFRETLIEEVEAPIILGNTYHLYLRPGLDIIEQGGGLHKFINWPMPILTDSGGYQVYSLAKSRKLKPDGVDFQSHVDGSRHFFSPESAIDIQRSLGADIIMAFDECTPYPCEYEYARKSMDLTHQWLKKCVDRFEATSDKYGHAQSLFPIIQGSVYPDLRGISADFCVQYAKDGIAIGGLSVGEPEHNLYEITELVCEKLPTNIPRYLMGVGTPANLLECISLGIDMFDCVMPTRNARNGQLFTKDGVINIRNKKWASDFSPINEDIGISSSTNHSKAYLRHLLMSNELLGLQIATVHNLGFYIWLMKSAREKIINGKFEAWKKQLVPKLKQKI